MFVSELARLYVSRSLRDAVEYPGIKDEKMQRFSIESITDIIYIVNNMIRKMHEFNMEVNCRTLRTMASWSLGMANQMFYMLLRRLDDNRTWDTVKATSKLFGAVTRFYMLNRKFDLISDDEKFADNLLIDDDGAFQGIIDHERHDFFTNPDYWEMTQLFQSPLGPNEIWDLLVLASDDGDRQWFNEIVTAMIDFYQSRAETSRYLNHIRSNHNVVPFHYHGFRCISELRGTSEHGPYRATLQTIMIIQILMAMRKAINDLEEGPEIQPENFTSIDPHAEFEVEPFVMVTLQPPMPQHVPYRRVIIPGRSDPFRDEDFDELE